MTNDWTASTMAQIIRRSGGILQVFSGREFIEVATELTVAVFGLLGMTRDWAPDENGGSGGDASSPEESDPSDEAPLRRRPVRAGGVPSIGSHCFALSRRIDSTRGRPDSSFPARVAWVNQASVIDPEQAPGTTTFEFRFEPRYQRWARWFGVTPASAFATVGPHHLEAHFGPWAVRTPLSNIAAIDITGPYYFWKTGGPAHLSFRDGGLTFATNGTAGVCISFAVPVPGLEPLGRIRHRTLTVTVGDCAAFAARLRSGIAGLDVTA